MSLIVTTEPLFAALTAAVFLGQRFNCFEYLGGALVVAALIGNELLGGEGEVFGAPRLWKEEKVLKRLGPRSQSLAPAEGWTTTWIHA